MDDYLAKPFDREELHRLLERWCRGLVSGQDSTRAARREEIEFTPSKEGAG